MDKMFIDKRKDRLKVKLKNFLHNSIYFIVLIVFIYLSFIVLTNS